VFAQALRFGCTGVLNTLIDVAVFVFLIHVVSVQPTIANVISYSVGLLCSFMMNNWWTFSIGRQPGLPQRFGRFVLVNVSSLAVSTGTVAFTLRFTTPLVGKILSLPMTFLWNFLLCRRFVFRYVPREL
jgi:putative flippase GtrA